MAKSKNIPDDKDIYLAFSTVFKGSCAQIRKASAIQRLVKQSEKQTEVAQFFARNNHKSMRAVIYDRLKVLLEQRVFESYSRARLRFPDLFVETATQTAERAASEAMAATDHARAVEGALLGDQEVVDDTFTDSGK
ncbi:hypothetical protein N0V82_009494 [Gnomoniopsis sp. IMI 355080]|nr:hypothetical protein N0V82_009494 [Gnomoniopsis sp. IMI 355080]